MKTTRCLLSATALFCACALLCLTGCSEDTAPEAGPGAGVCTPDARECLDPANFKVCRPDGSGFDFGTCPGDQPCMNGLCAGNAPNPDPNPGPNPDPNPGPNPDPNPGPNPDPNPDPNPGPNPDPGPDADHTAGPCEPFTRECVNNTLLRICRGDGTAYDLGICPEDNPCVSGGYCANDVGEPGTCTPDVRECFDARTVRICRGDGTAFDFYTCPGQMVCDGAACRDTGNCTDSDGDGYGEGPDCLGPDCDDNNFSINPEGSETCGNNIDEDCDTIDAPCNCDPVAQDCPGDNLMCSLGRNDSFECRSEGVLGEGELCGGIPSNCQRGLECIITGDDNQSRCTRMCNNRTGDGCIGEAVCGATLTGFDNVGLCIGVTRCDPVDSPLACGPGSVCQPISDRDALCFEGGGNLMENATCNQNNDQCASGFACITIQGGDNPGTRCKAYCKVNRGNADCRTRQGEACQPIELSFNLNGRNETINGYGICN